MSACSLHCIIYALDTNGLYFQRLQWCFNELTENNIKIVLLTLLSTLIFFGYFFLMHNAGKKQQNVSLQLSCLVSLQLYILLPFLCSLALLLIDRYYQRVSGRREIKKVLSMHFYNQCSSLPYSLYIYFSFLSYFFVRSFRTNKRRSQGSGALTVITLSMFLIAFTYSWCCFPLG